MPTVWETWGYTTSSSSVTTADIVFPAAWLGTASTYDTATTQTWTLWCDTTGTTGGTLRYLPPTQPSAKVLARRRQDGYRQKRIARLAQLRSEELLIERLNVEQREEFHRDRAFTVCARSGRRYRVRHGWAGNVDELIDGRKVAVYCIHPHESVPIPDSMLAQKLLLEHDEESFHRIANRTPVAA